MSLLTRKLLHDRLKPFLPSQLGSLVHSPELEMRELRKGMGITSLDHFWFTYYPTY